MVEKLKIPVLTALSGIDLIESEAPYFFGRPGILGERPANFILQNADLILIIGTRMNLRQIGFNYSSFGRAARKVMVDIDPAELGKPTLNIDEPICRDAGEFLKELEACGELPPKPQWLAYAARLKRRYPVVLPEYRAAKQWVNSYVFGRGTVVLSAGRRDHRHRQWHRLYESVSGYLAESRQQNVRECRVCVDGIRVAGGDWSGVCRSRQARDLRDRGRKLANEFTGAANSGHISPSGKIVCIQ